MKEKPFIASRFGSVAQRDVPHGRNGKHKVLVTEILQDLAALQPGYALKIPLDALETSKAKIRSALNRASLEASTPIKTSSDAEFLYVWKAESADPRKSE